MADKKKKGCGLDAPAIGTFHPKGTVIKKNANGTITLVDPKKKGKK